jgi:protoporphyrin/coproporphyrin ferrochelatase
VSERRHVVLVTYGEPPTPAFVDQLVYSWRILLGLTRTVAPIPAPLVPLIAWSRGRGRHRMWTEHHYSSPLEPITVRQAERLRQQLQALDPAARWCVHVAYEFRRPLLDDLLAALPDGDPVWVAPMYAADSAFTHALSRGTVARLARNGKSAVSVLGALDGERLAALSAAHVLESTQAEGWTGADVALVLAAHGTLITPARPIATGLAATEALCAAITARLAASFGLVVNGWLNHTRGGQWTDPPIEAALEQVAAAGYRRLVYFPYGFLADNAESELEGRIALAAHPNITARHLACLNDSPRLLDALAVQVLTAAAAARTAAPPAVVAASA